MSRGKRRRFRNRGRRKEVEAALRSISGRDIVRALFDLQTRKDEIGLEAFDAWFRDYLQNFPGASKSMD